MFFTRWSRYIFPFCIWCPPQRSLRKSLDLLLLHKHQHGSFFRISFFTISFRSFSSWFNSLLGLTNENRQQFTKTTSFLLILLEMLNTEWCFYLHHGISAHLNFCRVCSTLKGNSSPLSQNLSFNSSIILW